MSDVLPQAMSELDYLRTEHESPFKREYVGGFAYPLHPPCGVNSQHVRINGALAYALFAGADAQGCRLYHSMMRLRVLDSYFYPDVMLVCDKHQPHDYYETAPCFIAEVTSGSTAHNDRRHKYSVYTGLPSLQTYLIVSQEERYVVEYQRVEGKWQMREVRGAGEVAVPCLGLTLTLEQIYRGLL